MKDIKPKNLPDQIWAKYKKYKKNAETRGIPFELHPYVFHSRMVRPCYICGKSGEDLSNGLDRVENSDGYNSMNVAACCWNCNRAKNNMSLREFKEWMSRFGEVKDSILYAEKTVEYKNKGCIDRSEMALMLFDEFFREN